MDVGGLVGEVSEDVLGRQYIFKSYSDVLIRIVWRIVSSLVYLERGVCAEGK